MTDKTVEMPLEGDTGETAAHKPLILAMVALLGAGAMLAVSTNLAKVAAEKNMQAVAFLFWSVAGASVLLLAVAALRRHLPPICRKTVVYFLVAAFFTVAGSNLIFFEAVPRVGVGFVVLALTLPPVLTYIGALTLGMERRCMLRFAGIAFAFAGSGYLAFRQLSLPDAEVIWIALTLLGPVLLAAGNIYRSHQWPEGLAPDALAPGMMVGALVLVAAASFLPGNSIQIVDPSGQQIGLVALQSVAFALQFTFVFVLQKHGGPVFLSLFGSVAAVLGIPMAVQFLGETVPPGLLVGGIGIAIGIALMALGHARMHRA